MAALMGGLGFLCVVLAALTVALAFASLRRGEPLTGGMLIGSALLCGLGGVALCVAAFN